MAEDKDSDMQGSHFDLDIRRGFTQLVYKLNGMAELCPSPTFSYLRAYSKSSSLSQKALIVEHRSAVYIVVNEQRSAKNRRLMAKIGDFEQALSPLYPSINLITRLNIVLTTPPCIQPKKWIRSPFLLTYKVVIFTLCPV